MHCGARHTVVNNVFAGNAAETPSPFGPYLERDYAAEPFCNFQSHGGTVQGSTVLRNIFDQHVAPSVGIGRFVPVYNNNTVAKQPYGTATNVFHNVTLDHNVFSCFDSTACHSDFPGDAAHGRSLASWQAWGHQDMHSVGGDPGFAPDAATALKVRKDFRVDPSRSAAVRAVGFVPLNLESVGPRVERLAIASCNNNGGDTGVWWQGCTY